VAIIRPFRALRPQPERAQEVASVPYDVVNTDEARALAEGKRSVFCTYRDLKSTCRRTQISTATSSIEKQSRTLKN
jgi:uncharacterized protein (DUF1015 family)